ncbi:MAG: radical SAM protein [Candidatus Omnitrophota bacterium]
MSMTCSSVIPVREAAFFHSICRSRSFTGIEFELTARCNNNCRHCYINLPVNDRAAERRELSFNDIKDIARQAVSEDMLWCSLTGGEPLLRKDFPDIYVHLKKSGFLVSVFTNATLITDKYIRLFREYPPRNIEVTVYGVTAETYERVSRVPGSFGKFMRGIDLLRVNKLATDLKAMVMRSNVREFSEIARFCRERNNRLFRFDPFLFLRADRNEARNSEIRMERLTEDEVFRIERIDKPRRRMLESQNRLFLCENMAANRSRRIFRCLGGENTVTIGWQGRLQLCNMLIHPDCLFDVKKHGLARGLREFIPAVRNTRSCRSGFLKRCRSCKLVHLCMWCPASSHLETGVLDEPIEYFCRLAHGRFRICAGTGDKNR